MTFQQSSINIVIYYVYNMKVLFGVYIQIKNLKTTFSLIYQAFHR